MSPSFAALIRDLRRRHGLTQQQLAEIADVSLPSITRIERGKETARLDVLVKILDALGYELTAKPKASSTSERATGEQ